VRELPYGIESAGLANLLGCFLIFACAVCQGLVAVTTRIMQAVPWNVILFYYSITGVLVFGTTYIATTDSVSRLADYSGTQLGWIGLTAGIQNIALITKCIASQVEKSGIITMFGYLGLIYACFVDVFVFDDALSWVEWLGASIILLTTIALTFHLFKTKERADYK